PGALDGGDVHEDVAAAVVRLDEAVAALGIEELDRTCHGHRETPFPVVAPPPTPRHGGSAGHSQTGKAAALRPPLLRRAPTGGGTSKPAQRKSANPGLWKSGEATFRRRANGRSGCPTRP